jgi:signal transduction histidine kinase/ActR/RegA family two-component response regulator
MKKIRFEYKFTAIYLFLGFLWILFSDSLLNSLISDNAILTRMQTYKGWFYVTVTTILFYTILQKHLKKLRNAEQKAVESDRLKTAFLQNISHEIRTPMNGIIGFAGLLEDENLSELQRKEYLTTIKKSSNRLLDLVNQVLDISLIETGSVVAHYKPFRLNQLVEEIHEIWAPQMKEGINFSFSKGFDNENDTIITDEVKLKQLLNNLIGNAVKFTETGYIRFGYSAAGKELTFFVEDSGIGIPNEYHEDIFNRFHKIERNSSRFYDGAGLGLAICKSTLDMLQGRMVVESEPGAGSVFRFTIPYKLSKTVDSSKAVANIESINGLIILVAEDEMMNFRYIEELLIGTGIKLIHASDGEEAVEQCKKRDDISLVLMDIRMPNMNGFDATRLIREIRPELPVVAQSAYLIKNEIHQDLQVKFDDYLSKPFLRDELLHAILKNVPIK